MILPNGEEETMIKQFLILPIVMSVFNRDKKIIEQVGLKTKEPYIDFFDRALNSLNQEITIIRKEFGKRGIKILDTKRNMKELSCRYLCRGYQGSFKLMMYQVKIEVELKMRRCLGEDIGEFYEQIKKK